jgi:hypothetical protein
MEMNDSEIREWLHSMDIYDYDICDGVVHVVGSVYIIGLWLSSIPVQFGYVGGNFHCGYNQLKSLKGGPSEVGGNFDCSYNQLKSLKGGPKEVGGSFYCRGNLLVSLEGGPELVGVAFNCINNAFKDEPDFSHITIGGGVYVGG